MSRKEAILDKAIALFNEQGIRTISTNHIAKELGISPGNLYYHYRNKEEIIRSIFERMIQDWDQLWSNSGDSPGVETFVEVMRKNFGLLWKYRFFQREHLALMQNDEQLKARYKTIYQQRIAQFQVMADTLKKAEIIRQEVPKETLKMLLQACWLVGDYWISHLELVGDPEEPAQLEEGIQTFFLILQPYFTQKAQGELAHVFK